MKKYAVIGFVLVVILVALMFYVGETSQLVLSSLSPRGVLTFETQLSWRMVIIIFTLSIIISLLLWSLFGWAIQLPARWRSLSEQRRQTQALNAMQATLQAGAVKNITKTRKRAEKMRQAFADTPHSTLSVMASAIAAQAAQDYGQASHYYRELLQGKSSRAFGLRGLIAVLDAMEEPAQLREQAQQAYTQDPAHEHNQWAFEPLFRTQVNSGLWQEAVQTLQLAIRRKHIDSQKGRRQKAALLVAQADSLFARGESDQAENLASQASALCPEFLPASLCGAKIFAKAGKTRKASKLLEKSWTIRPHAALAYGLRAIHTKQGESFDAANPPAAYSRVISALVKAHPEHRESLILQAEDYFSRNLYVEALAVLDPLLTAPAGEPSARICALKAAIDNARGEVESGYLWAQRGLRAPAEPLWPAPKPMVEQPMYSRRDWQALIFAYASREVEIRPYDGSDGQNSAENGVARAPLLRYAVGDPAPIPPNDIIRTDIISTETAKTIEPESQKQTKPEEESKAETENKPENKPENKAL